MEQIIQSYIQLPHILLFQISNQAEIQYKSYKQKTLSRDLSPRPRGQKRASVSCNHLDN